MMRQGLHSQVINIYTKKPIVLSILDHKENLFKLEVLKPKLGTRKSTNDYKSYEKVIFKICIRDFGKGKTSILLSKIPLIKIISL